MNSFKKAYKHDPFTTFLVARMDGSNHEEIFEKGERMGMSELLWRREDSNCPEIIGKPGIQNHCCNCDIHANELINLKKTIERFRQENLVMSKKLHGYSTFCLFDGDPHIVEGGVEINIPSPLKLTSILDENIKLRAQNETMRKNLKLIQEIANRYGFAQNIENLCAEALSEEG